MYILNLHHRDFFIRATSLFFYNFQLLSARKVLFIFITTFLLTYFSYIFLRFKLIMFQHRLFRLIFHAKLRAWVLIELSFFCRKNWRKLSWNRIADGNHILKVYHIHPRICQLYLFLVSTNNSEFYWSSDKLCLILKNDAPDTERSSNITTDENSSKVANTKIQQYCWIANLFSKWNTFSNFSYLISLILILISRYRIFEPGDMRIQRDADSKTVCLFLQFTILAHHKLKSSSKSLLSIRK